MSVTQTPTTEADATPKSSLRRHLSLELLDNRYPSLHGLRVLAILSVIQYHVTWIFTGEQGVPLDIDFVAASLSVFFGMDLFFILSGFLIGAILLHSLAQSGTQNIRRFYLRRIFRTFPSYWVVLTILVLAFPLTDGQREHLPYEYLYLTNFMPLLRTEIIMFWGWSLSLEEQFYLAVPLLFFVLHKLPHDRARIYMLLALWLVPLGIRLFLFFAYAPWNDFLLYDTLYFRTPTRIDPIVCGILLAIVHVRYGEQLTKWLEHPFHRALLAVPACAFLWVLLQPTMFGVDHVQLLHVFSWGTFTSLMYFPALILLLHGGDGWIRRGLSHPIFRYAATVGYGVYLVHIPLIDHIAVPFAHAMMAREVSLLIVWPVAFVGVTVASFAIGYVMHLVIEKPSMRIRQWLAA
jgi:peptidoglycan/LPS O-acetylase OafA/YrhL